MWSSNLRPDEAFDDRLPEAWYFKVVGIGVLCNEGEDACEFQDACFYRWRDCDRM